MITQKSFYYGKFSLPHYHEKRIFAEVQATQHRKQEPQSLETKH